MFNVGDKVRVKTDLEYQQYNRCHFVPGMGVYRGRTGKIVKKWYDDYQTRRYKLDIADEYYFSNDMLDPINDFDLTLPYEIGDRIRIINEIPEDRYGIFSDTWLKMVGKSGKIIKINTIDNSYLVFISAIKNSFWLPSEYFKKELTNENLTENISKLIECIPEIELSYCKKQIYTI